MTLKFGARFRRLPSGATRSPSAALQFWTVRHALTHRLEPYKVTEVPLFWAQASWQTLRFWAMLLDGDDESITRLAGHDPDAYIPTPEEWFGKVKA